MKDTYHDNKAVLALAPAVAAAAVDGNAIDLKGFDSALIIINTGAIVGAGDFGAKLQESDDPATGYTDVAAADQLGTLPVTLATSSTYRVGYIGSKLKRYIRVSVTKAGGTSIAIGASAVLGHPHLAPVA